MDIGIFGARGVPSTYGGYETFLTTLAPALVERGHSVTVYCRADATGGTQTWRGVQCKVLPSIAGKNSSTLSHGLTSSIAAFRAHHDVVLAVNVANAAFCGAMVAGGASVVLNTDGQEWARDKWGPMARRVFRLSAKVSRRCATALITDSAEMCRIYSSEFSAPSTVIPYCAPDSDWSPSTAPLKARGLKPAEYFVIAGRHNPETQLDTVAAAYAASNTAVPLVVLGVANYDSSVTRNLVELASKDPRIVLVGHVDDRHEYFDLVHHASAYLHGHTVGGTNPALVEAMAVGARIAAADNAFNRETLGEAGEYFTAGSAECIQLLQNIENETDRCRAMWRARARARSVARFSKRDVIDAYESILASAANSNHKRNISIQTMWTDLSHGERSPDGTKPDDALFGDDTSLEVLPEEIVIDLTDSKASRPMEISEPAVTLPSREATEADEQR